jgi:hypothetical protein
MMIGTALSWAAVIMIVTMIDPTGSRWPVFLVFYVSLFLAVGGTFSVIGFLSRVAVLGQRLHLSRQVAVSFRQAVMVAVMTIALLLLQSKTMLTWWNAALIIGTLTLFESFFISLASKAAK